MLTNSVKNFDFEKRLILNIVIYILRTRIRILLIGSKNICFNSRKNSINLTKFSPNELKYLISLKGYIFSNNFLFNMKLNYKLE